MHTQSTPLALCKDCCRPIKTDILHENYLPFGSNLSFHRISSLSIIPYYEEFFNRICTLFYCLKQRNISQFCPTQLLLLYKNCAFYAIFKHFFGFLSAFLAFQSDIFQKNLIFFYFLTQKKEKRGTFSSLPRLAFVYRNDSPSLAHAPIYNNVEKIQTNSLATFANSIQTTIPMAVGKSAVTTVHLKLPVSFFTVISVVEHGQ